MHVLGASVYTSTSYLHQINVYLDTTFAFLVRVTLQKLEDMVTIAP